MPKTAFRVFALNGEVFGPGYTNPVPDDVAEEVTNPAIWEKPDDEDGEDSPDDEEPADTGPPAPESSAVDERQEPAADQQVPEPPRSGTGSGLPAWRAFADSRGVSYPDDADRGAVIAACREAGVIS